MFSTAPLSEQNQRQRIDATKPPEMTASALVKTFWRTYYRNDLQDLKDLLLNFWCHSELVRLAPFCVCECECK